MCKSLRYCVSHCLYVLMTKLDEANREANMQSSIRYLGYLARTSLLVAICMGLYVRWEKTEDSLILVIFILGLFVLGIASILYYYFSMEAASLCLSHLWFGFLLGLLCFLDKSSSNNDMKEDATKYLLISSMSIRTLCSLVERICGCVCYRPTLLTAVEFLELVGFAVASMTILLEKATNIILLVAALAMLMIDLRMKSFLAVPNLVIFGLIASLLFFPSLDIQINPFALGCFFICLVCDPLFDVYFSGLSVTERWKPYLFRGAICRRLSIIFVGCIELIFFILSTFILGHLKIWYFVIPGFSIFGIFWLVCHVIFLITLWGFHTKLNECHRVFSTHRTENSCLDRVMASKGMRHFCLISERLVFFSLLATAVFGAVSWQVLARTRILKKGRKTGPVIVFESIMCTDFYKHQIVDKVFLLEGMYPKDCRCKVPRGKGDLLDPHTARVPGPKLTRDGVKSVKSMAAPDVHAQGFVDSGAKDMVFWLKHQDQVRKHEVVEVKARAM